jgi:hypothetical protein
MHFFHPLRSIITFRLLLQHHHLHQALHWEVVITFTWLLCVLSVKWRVMIAMGWKKKMMTYFPLPFLLLASSLCFGFRTGEEA